MQKCVKGYNSPKESFTSLKPEGDEQDETIHGFQSNPSMLSDAVKL